jgi:hypothetical protein
MAGSRNDIGLRIWRGDTVYDPFGSPTEFTYVYKKAPAFGGKEHKAGAVKSCKFKPAALLLILIFQKIYSVLRLRSQLTKPIPILPNKTAPGAGIASDR